MTVLDRLIDNVVAERAPLIRRDAEALLTAALWRDLPAVAVLDDPSPGLAGSAIGSGHWVAQTAGLRPGTVAVRVACRRLLREWLDKSPDDFDLAVDGATLDIEHVAAHEIAHALVTPLDAELPDDEAATRITQAQAAGETRTPERTASTHPARWAAAFGIVAVRCAELRPVRLRDLWRGWTVRDLERYGHDLVAIEAVMGAVPADVPLRDLLAPGGEVATRIAAVARPDATRIEIIRRSMFDVSPTSEPLVAAMAAGVPMKEVFK